jgi:hypothetical protein
MIKRNAHTCRWRVDFDLAYDGGGSAWTQYYWTKFGARFSMFWHKQIASWSGSAELTEVP